MSKQYFVMAHDQARLLAAKACSLAPEGYVVEIKPPSRSLEQNAMLHSLIGQISTSIQWAGGLQSIEVWKRLLTAAWLRARGDVVTILPAIDGHGVDIVFKRTSDLNVAEMNELIEYIQAWMAEQSLEE